MSSESFRFLLPDGLRNGIMKKTQVKGTLSALPVLSALRQLAAAEYSRPLFSYSDRACVGRNNLATDTDKHAEYTVAVGSSVLPGTSFLRQAVPGGCVYRISVEADAV